MISVFASIRPKRSRKIDAFRRGASGRLANGVNRATELTVNAIKEELSRGGGSARRNISQPGPRGGTRLLRSAPRNLTNRLRIQTGALRSSWRSIEAKRVGRFVEGHVITRSPYAAIHEFGGTAGRGGSVRLRERPYIRPTIKRHRQRIIRLLAGDFLRPLR